MKNPFIVHQRIEQTEKDLREFNKEQRNSNHDDMLFRGGSPIVILEGFDSDDDDINVGVQRALHLRRCRAMKTGLVVASH